MAERRKVIIDCDPGIDDAVGLLFAMRRPEFEILGITAVAGNGPVEFSTMNALKLTELAGRSDIPVYRGEEKPVRRERTGEDGASVHGADYMGENDLPAPEKTAFPGAADFILEMAEKEQITVITVGAMSNLAAAYEKNPEKFRKIESIFSMGGSVLYGNMTPVAEYNYWSDPEAAQMVFESGVPIFMLGLNMTEQIPFTKEHQARLLKGDACCRFEGKALEWFFALPEYGQELIDNNCAVLHDLTAVIACCQPELFSWKHCHVEISTAELTRGECVADMRGDWEKEKNCYVATSVKIEEYYRLFFETMMPEE